MIMQFSEKEILSILVSMATVLKFAAAASDCQGLSDCMKEYSTSISRLNIDFSNNDNIARIVNILCSKRETLEKCYSKENLQSCSIFGNLPMTSNTNDRISKQFNLICNNEDDFVDFVICLKKTEVHQYVLNCITAVSKQMNNKEGPTNEDICNAAKAMDKCILSALMNSTCTDRATATYTAISQENIKTICPTSSTLVICSNLFFLITLFITKIVFI